MEEAFFLGDMISVMIEGKIHQTGTKEDVYRSPGTIDAARFFGIRNIFEAEVIDSGNDRLIARCSELNADLSLPRYLFTHLPDHSFTIGIRAGDVMISREDLKRPGQDNLLKGRVVEIYPKGASHLILFIPDGTKRGIEIEIPDYAFNKLSLSTGQDVSVILSGASMFVLDLKP
jgi:ABC-type Fe3+/spermidine/putrescine transport system ATPase subunit